MSEKEIAIVRRVRRQLRTRKKLHGTSDCPRLSVFRSSKHIYAQLINDDQGVTIVSAGTTEPDVKKDVSYGGNKSAATVIGKLIGERAKAQGIDRACFDRRSYRYHGRVASLADAAREAGLKF